MRNIQRIRSLATTPMTFTAANTYIGQVGELVSVFDDSDGTAVALRIHDGNTVGGLLYYQINSYVPSSDPNAPNQDGVDNTYTGIPAGWLTENVIDYSAYFDGSSWLSSSAFSGAVDTFTASLWVKRGRLKTGEYDLEGFFTVATNGGCKSSYNFNNVQRINIYDNAGSNSSSNGNIVYNDLSAFYHIVIVSNSGVLSFYRNNVLDFTDNRVSTTFASGDQVILGAYTAGGDLFAGHIANVQFIDGAALDPSYFGETVEGNWIHRPYDGTSTVEGATPVSGLGGTNDKYGTNGFYLNFADESDLGKDVSGNGNDWT